jgi:Tol biopolymer transport system component
VTGATVRVSVASDGTEGNEESSSPSISADGRYVAFASYASNLVPDDTNDCVILPPSHLYCSDVFVHDRKTGATTRVSVGSYGTQGHRGSGSPDISADGRYITFSSSADNLVLDDTNFCGRDGNCSDVFVHDRMTAATTRVSVASDGTEGNNHSYRSSISADGRYVALQSVASNLVPGDTNDLCYNNSTSSNCSDIFVHDRATGTTTRVSVASDGTEGNEDSYGPSISTDGRYVAFSSSASNLVLGDTNVWADVFIHDRYGGYEVVLLGNVSQTGAQETAITYTLTMHNTGIISDTYDVSLNGASWPTLVDGPTSVSLPPGATSEATVVVSVPADAATGAMDIVTLAVTSQGNPLVTDSVELTTIAGIFNDKSYLPIWVKS